jgi:hypothetical protein
MNQTTRKTPVHLWIVGILAVLWNAVGAYDYIATQYKIESYMSQFTPEQLEYFYNFPVWVDAAWAIAIWASVLGSITLLMRKPFAVWLFGVAILGLATSSVYNFVLSDGKAIMGDDAVTFTAVIWLIALFLYFYSSAMIKRRVLT